VFTSEHAGGRRPWILVSAALTFMALGTACSSSSKTSSTSASTPTPTTTIGTVAPTTTTTATTAAPTTTSLAPAAWGAAHGTNIALVISTANGLVSAIDKGDPTAINTSCSALSRNYKTLLQPIPDPSEGPTAKLFNQAKDEIYLAQKDCSAGPVRKANLASAATEAKTGAALLHQVLDATGG
jgi:hypothetical protein